MIADHLYNPDIPDCDLVIRTSGEAAHVELPAVGGRLRRSLISCPNCSPTAAAMSSGAPSTTTSTAIADSAA